MTRYVEDFANGYYFVDKPDFTGTPDYTVQQSGTAAPAESPPTPPQAPAPLPVVFPAVAAQAVTPIPVPRVAPTNLPVPLPVGTARYALADYAAALRQLLPRGRAWPDDPAGGQAAMLRAIAATLERSDAAANALLGGTLPGNLSVMLPEWEAALGLPDACVSAAPTIAQRLDQVRGKFVGAGGQSRQHFLDYAAALGFTISITNYAPFRAGRSTAGQPVSSDAWTFVWGIRVLAISGTLPVAALMCALEAVRPAETTVLNLDAAYPVLEGVDGSALLAPNGDQLLGPLN